MDATFRTAQIEAQPSQEAPIKDTPTISGKEDVAISGEPIEHSDLEDWEIQNGKYGLEWLGIKEVGKEFPYNAQFSEVDKFIKEEIKERGFDSTREQYQEILKEIEEEIGSQKMNALERLQKLKNYISVLKKMKALKKKQAEYRSLSSGEVS